MQGLKETDHNWAPLFPHYFSVQAGGETFPAVLGETQLLCTALAKQTKPLVLPSALPPAEQFSMETVRMWNHVSSGWVSTPASQTWAAAFLTHALPGETGALGQCKCSERTRKLLFFFFQQNMQTQLLYSVSTGKLLHSAANTKCELSCSTGHWR